MGFFFAWKSMMNSISSHSLLLVYAIPRKSQAVRGKFTKTLSLCSKALLFPKSKNFQRPAWACPARQRCFAPGLRLPASASLSLASCWPRPQQRLPVSATGGGRRRCTLAIFSGKIIYILPTGKICGFSRLAFSQEEPQRKAASITKIADFSARLFTGWA